MGPKYFNYQIHLVLTLWEMILLFKWEEGKYGKEQWLMALSRVHESPLYKAGELVFSLTNHPGKFPSDQAGTIRFTYSAEGYDSKYVPD